LDEDGAARTAAHGLSLRPSPTEVLAVPADVVRLVWPLLERDGRVLRGHLGIETRDADAALRGHLGLETGGHVIEALVPEGPGARQGLVRHDVIVAVGGVPVEPGRPLHEALLPFRPGTRVTLGLVRAGKRLEVEVVLGAPGAR
ncbi:MAG: PDZ domain-containing protein, partial [Planctomycetota bacterium]|nr:PDZ domain-containing protein [Planctomycetota bacterium]